MYITEVFEEIPLKVRNKITNEVVRLGYDLKYIVRYSNHVKDDYLYLVMGKGGYRGGYVVWLFNNSVGSLCDGHYDMNLKSALKDLSNRMTYIE